MTRIALSLALTIVAACGPPPGRDAEPAPDAATAALAVQALDQRMPGHPAIVAAKAYEEDGSLVYGPNTARSGLMRIYVYQLADGSYHAAGVYCGVGGCWPWPSYKGNFGPQASRP